ncbi:hypothetical protein FJ959_22230 [Mesorhizobium sp. B2-2-4]|uniref:hypothetical protein n=1 Tax=unclassified Mesorhizobium TaxID=325217 RepID=UPI001127DD85|nr:MULTISPECIES: hypothetical protein [unclassified Mesorhizobium]TPM53252.1 hypothetical protein FJ959_22230 [Mesorhizobium sp. B2-2-4]TPM62106.1 hypothetical protein FJ965_21140 [Mesorhizobium sp. B2-2-1]TPN68477.1 hypothetical protein FJ984_11620 [Mesorhizobium sp. B1-1-3]
MGDTKRVRSDLQRGISVMSTATTEAFGYLNELTKRQYRGWGDTATAARDRAARDAGITPAQAERVWKRWKVMPSIDGDVYRALRNRYEALCERVENAARDMDRLAREIEENDATDQSRPAVAGGMAKAAQGAEREMR